MDKARDAVLMPLYGFMQGDTLGLLILSQDTDTICEVIKKIKISASPRLDTRAEYKLVYKGKVLRQDLTVVQAGLEALERVDLVRK